MKSVAIVNYGMGNLDSVARAVEECGGSPVIASQARDLEVASYIILPGVGAFAIGMQNIRERNLECVLKEQVVGKRVPFLGVCLGMQLLATKGCEGQETEGLGWIEGEVKRLEPDVPNVRIPHVGWNEVVFNQASPLFDGLPSGKDFYFVHSYHLACQNACDVVARTPYCGGFVSAVNRDNIFGVQFHPEKSQRPGFQVIKNFLAL
jgi:glutamine amidotransferase